MSSQPSRRNLRKNKDLLSALDREIDLQRTDVSVRSGGMSTRASILIAAASLSTALQAGQQGYWFLVAIWLSVASAILGAIVLLPRLGHQLDVQKNEADLWDTDPLQLKRDLTYQKLRILRQDEKAMLWRRYVLLAGFATLAASLAAAALHLSFNIQPEWEPDV